MNSLNDKANALRELAARLDRIDTEIKALLGDAPVQIIDISIERLFPPIKRFEFVRPVVIEPVVPPLAFGQVIYKRTSGEPRFITKGKDGSVIILNAHGRRANGYASLQALADHGLSGERSTYVLKNPDASTGALGFGDVVYMQSWTEKRNEPRFLTRGEHGVHLIGPNGETANALDSLERVELQTGPGKQYSRFPL